MQYRNIRFVALLLGLALANGPVLAGPAEWNQPQAPFAIYGNTWYVGVHGLSSVN